MFVQFPTRPNEEPPDAVTHVVWVKGPESYLYHAMFPFDVSVHS